MSYLVFLRHGKSIKNIKDIHGGHGSRLTQDAEPAIRQVADDFNRMGIKPTVIFSSPVPQAIETSLILGSLIKTQTIIEQLLKPLYLGVLSGLSRQEAKQQYPGPAKLIEKWRQGDIELHQLIIPGAENYTFFYQRGLDLIATLEHDNQDKVIVGTRSILICLISILLGRSIKPGGGYREIPMACCDYFTFLHHQDSYILDLKHSNCIFTDETR